VAVGITDRAVPVCYCGHWLELAVVTDTEVAYRGPSIPSNGQCVNAAEKLHVLFLGYTTVSFRVLSYISRAQIVFRIQFCFYCVYSYLID